MARLSREFYAGDTVAAARALLGTYLVRRLDGALLAGRITETEAYVGRCDKACHAYQYRKTPRTATLFLPPGHSYVYLIYGMYHCLNFVTEPEGEPAAVLIRAAEPAAGTETICRLRYGKGPGALTAAQWRNLLNGPGKLCRGFGLTRADNALDLVEGETLFVTDSLADLGLPDPSPCRERIRTAPRVGIDYAEEDRGLPWRFILEKEA